MIQEEMRRGKSVAFRMLFGKSACFVPEFLTLQGVEPGHLRVQAHRETAGYVLSYQESYILSAPAAVRSSGRSGRPPDTFQVIVVEDDQLTVACQVKIQFNSVIFLNCGAKS